MNKLQNLLEKNCNSLSNANLERIITDENIIIEIPEEYYLGKIIE